MDCKQIASDCEDLVRILEGSGTGQNKIRAIRQLIGQTPGLSLVDLLAALPDLPEVPDGTIEKAHRAVGDGLRVRPAFVLAARELPASVEGLSVAAGAEALVTCLCTRWWKSHRAGATRSDPVDESVAERLSLCDRIQHDLLVLVERDSDGDSADRFLDLAWELVKTVTMSPPYGASEHDLLRLDASARALDRRVSESLPSGTVSLGNPLDLLGSSDRDAWAAYERAVRASPELADSTDDTIFKWIVEFDQESHYRHDDCETWKRYVRNARKALGTQKHSPRHTRECRSATGLGGR